MPVINQYTSIRLAQDVPQHQGRHDGVVERPDDGDELRDQVDGRDDPCKGEPQPSLAASRDARIAEKTAEQHDEVRDQGGQLACLGPPPDRDEDNDRHQPQGNRESGCDQQTTEHSGKPTTVAALSSVPHAALRAPSREGRREHRSGGSGWVDRLLSPSVDYLLPRPSVRGSRPSSDPWRRHGLRIVGLAPDPADADA